MESCPENNSSQNIFTRISNLILYYSKITIIFQNVNFQSSKKKLGFLLNQLAHLQF